jgi:hypothetical protein
MGAAHQCVAADRNHHTHSDSDNDGNGDDVADGHHDKRSADHVAHPNVAHPHAASAGRRPNAVADIGGTRTRAVANTVALTGPNADHRYTGVP